MSYPSEPIEDGAPAEEDLEMLFWELGTETHVRADDELSTPVPARRRRHAWPGRRPRRRVEL